MDELDCDYDRGWAWVVLFGVASHIYLLNVWVSNYGQFFVEIQSQTGCTAAEAAWIATANYMTLCFLSPVTNRLCLRFNHRPIIMIGSVITTVTRVLAAMFVTSLPMFTLTLGFIDGLGEACIFSPAVTFLSVYFKRRLGLANGVALSGCSLAILTGVRATSYALQHLGLRTTLILHAGASAQGIVTAALLFPKNKTVKNAKRLRLKLPNRVQIVQIISYSLGCITMITAPKYVAAYCKDLDISLTDTSWMLSFAGVPDVIAKGITGPLCDTRFIKCTVKSYRLYALSLVLLSGTTVILPSLTDYKWIFANFMVMFFACGFFNILSTIATVDLVGAKKYGITFSFMLWAASIFLLADIAVTAQLRDWTGSYQTSFYFLGSVSLVGAFLSMLQQFSVNKFNLNEQKNEQRDPLRDSMGDLVVVE